MRKSTLFISTALTIFVLAVMFKVVSAYQQIEKSKDVAVTQAATEPVMQPVSAVESVAAAPTVISPDQASVIAAAFMGDNAVYSVEIVEYEGAPAFLVTFSSGKLVYLSPTGEIIAISEVKPVIVQAPAPVKNNNNNGGNSNNNSGSSEPENHDEHDDHDD